MVRHCGNGELSPASGLANGVAGSAERRAIGDAWSGSAAPVDSSGLISAGALATAISPAPPGSETTVRAHARRLIAAANELLELAAELEQGGSPEPVDPAARQADPVAADEGRWLRHARQAYRHRRSRAHLFDESLFGEPAWDILLDLFIAAKERKRVPVTSACIGAAVPTTTALRWLTILEDRQLILREADPTDARRIFVRLTTEAYAKMVAYFARTAAGDGEEAAEAKR